MRMPTTTTNATTFLAQGPLFPPSLSFSPREIRLSIRFFAVISYISFDLWVGELRYGLRYTRIGIQVFTSKIDISKVDTPSFISFRVKTNGDCWKWYRIASNIIG